MKIYVITETSFEYNDEIYHTPESGGGEPVDAYSTKKSAETALKEKTKEWVLEHVSNDSRYYSGLGNYGYSPEEVINLSNFTSLTGISRKTVEEAWENDDGSADKILKDNIDATIECLEIIPFTITEIQLNEAASAR